MKSLTTSQAMSGEYQVAPLYWSQIVWSFDVFIDMSFEQLLIKQHWLMQWNTLQLASLQKSFPLKTLNLCAEVKK